MPDDGNFDELIYLRNEVDRLRKSLDLLTPGLDTILKRLGFSIYKKEPVEYLLIPELGDINEYYRMLHKYSFRLLLRDVIKNQDFFTPEIVTRYATPEKTSAYLAYLLRAGLIEEKPGGFKLLRHVKSFGPTLEWYVAEIFRREFNAEAAWGVKFKRPGIGGDYDVIAKLDGSVLYAEVKSSPPKQIYENEISAFLDRVSDLSPGVAVFLMDTELRMKDKIVPMFEQELGLRYAIPPEIIRIEKELFKIWDRIFIINSKDSIAGNIARVLNCYFRR